ncbi:hypothetical protein ABPG72_002538 [Tetrahymena utriculariae]
MHQINSNNNNKDNNNYVIPFQQNSSVRDIQNQQLPYYQQQQVNNGGAQQNQNAFSHIPSGQLLSSNYLYQQQLQQIFILEQECLSKCNQWFLQNNVRYKITNEQVRFSTMLEIEVFVLQTRNRIKQSEFNSIKYGSIFGVLLGTLFFYLNKEQQFTGESVFRINGLSAVGGGVFFYLLSKHQTVSQFVSHHNTTIDFPKFELFFESSLQDIYKLRKKLVE